MNSTAAQIVRAALREDVGRGDATTQALVPAAARTRAAIVARHACVVCGAAVAREVFRQVDSRIRCTVKVRDGAGAKPGDTLIVLEGPARGILTAERVALNFMQRMTGIATLTREFVLRAAPHGAAILDTRKTTPGLRALEKYAVKCGGGANHRFGLFDRVLIKDNHRALWAGSGRKSLANAVRAARARHPRLVVEIEVESEAELRDALEARPDWILLDNMTPARLRRCVKLNAGRAKLEASGGVTLATIARIAATGVDAVSVGALTHSAPAADLSLEFL
jgi:nicotinate-nucleotide pyrophosphorylase (carboxylating)